MGLLLAVASVVLTVWLQDKAGLGVMLGLVVLYMATLYVTGIGLLQLRSGANDVDAQAPTTFSWACLVIDHMFEQVRKRGDAPAYWQCRRCGKRRYTRPRSAGETLEATSVDELWIKRGDTLDDRPDARP